MPTNPYEPPQVECHGPTRAEGVGRVLRDVAIATLLPVAIFWIAVALMNFLYPASDRRASTAFVRWIVPWSTAVASGGATALWRAYDWLVRDACKPPP